MTHKAGGTAFKKFQYDDSTNSVTKVKWQYQTGSTDWHPSTPAEGNVTGGSYSSEPTIENVTKTRMSLYRNGSWTSWITGNEQTYTKTAHGQSYMQGQQPADSLQDNAT